jgi:ubiquitin carboxyl-terminal hydrolase 7
LKGKNFEKIKFAVVRRSSYSKPTYLTDGISSHASPLHPSLIRADDYLFDVATHEDDLLGLDHLDRTRAVRNGAGDLFLR